MPRSDGRENDQLRPVSLATGYNKHAEGSCLVEIGDTVVICTASVSNEVPRFMAGTQRGWVTAEYGMLPRAGHERTSRGRIQSSGRTYEIQRLVGRSLRAVVDLDALGERTITLDCDVIQADGGTRTAAVTGGYVAAVLALRELSQKGLIPPRGVVKNQVAAVSVGIIQGEPVLDLCYAEDSMAEVDLNVVMTSRGEIVEIQGTAEARTFSRKMLNRMLDLAWEGLQELFRVQKEALRG